MRHRTHHLLLAAFSALAIGLSPVWTPVASADEAPVPDTTAVETTAPDGSDTATEPAVPGEDAVAADSTDPNAGDATDPVVEDPVEPVVEDPAEPDDPAPQPVDEPAAAPDDPVAVAAEDEGGHDDDGHGEGGTLPEGVVVTVDGRDITSTDPEASLPKIASCTFDITASGLTAEPPDTVGIRIIAWPPTAPEENKVVLVDVTETSVDGAWAGSYPLDEAVQEFKRVGNGYHMRLEIFINGEKGAMKMYWLGCGEPQTGNPRRMLFDVQWVTADDVVLESGLDDVLPEGWRDDFALTASGERGTVDCSYLPGADELMCEYFNPGHGDAPGLVLPGKPGTAYTVEVVGVPDGWTVDASTIGTFLADDTCPKGSGGGHDNGGHEEEARLSHDDGEEGEEGEEGHESPEPCVHTVVINGPIDDEGNGNVNPPDDDGDDNAAPPADEEEAAANAALPVTGAATAPLLPLAVVLLVIGTALAAAARRPTAASIRTDDPR